VKGVENMAVVTLFDSQLSLEKHGYGPIAYIPIYASKNKLGYTPNIHEAWRWDWPSIIFTSRSTPFFFSLGNLT
jgi:hypothetical protein